MQQMTTAQQEEAEKQRQHELQMMQQCKTQ
jgi:hypothetical protein